jgi:glycosyltransferase involved in cell wall biosynthesis
MHGLIAFLEWWDETGINEYPKFGAIRFNDIAKEMNGVQLANKPYLEFGVNVVGFSQSILGIGEDARMASIALEINNIPTVNIKAKLNGPEASFEYYKRFNFSKTPKYSVSLFCLPPIEMVRLAVEGGRDLIEMQNYKIGAWPWELPYWPNFLHPIKYFVDEIWAQSEFVYQCFSRLDGSTVYKVPMIVSIPEPIETSRDFYNLNKNAYVFYSLFDGNSWLSRKNPLAAIYAFQKAFKDQSKCVQFVIKAMNISSRDPIWGKIVEKSIKDPRIKIISDQMSRQDLINFMNTCDCFVSLHRSEGFGRVLAEAMLLQQPVIATNFSGNTDFCLPSTAMLVDGELLQLKANDYLITEGQYWCDPDVEIASQHMLKLYEDRNFGIDLAKNGKAFIENHYSPDVVAKAYKSRLEMIKDKIDG